MEVPKKPKSPKSTRIRAAKALKKLPTALLLKKKAECDEKALRIVERMIEPDVNVDWLYKNLGLINKSHMDDIVEERSIGKLCGYALCDNPLIKVIGKQYQISTLRNKVYDIHRVKNFCSFRCYTAAEYLMGQMLTSPLWIREKEDIPQFQILPLTALRSRSPPGVEIDLVGLKLPDDIENQEADARSESEENGRSRGTTGCVQRTLTNQSAKGDQNSIDDVTDEGKMDKFQEKECTKTENKIRIEIKHKDSEKCNTIVEKDKIRETSPNFGVIGIQRSETRLAAGTNTKIPSKDNTKESVSFNPPSTKTPEETRSFFVLAPTDRERTVSQSVKKSYSENKKPEERKMKESNKKPVSFETLAMRVENSLKEWITEDTISLLHGKETDRRKILDNVSRQDKYTVLCKKLNRLQLEEDREDCEAIGKLKPAPQFAVLQEEAKNLKLKVSAFLKGEMVINPNIEMVTNSVKEEEEEPDTVLPLIDTHAPRTLRRKIFLDKLNRVMPDLLRALAGSSSRFLYTSERSTAVKALVSTFSLSATNITFKTAEWTLVALIIIKLLSLVDARMKYLMSSKQASMYTSMILMSYKLSSDYMDALVLSTTSPVMKALEKGLEEEEGS